MAFNPRGLLKDPRGLLKDPRGLLMNPCGLLMNPHGRLLHPPGRLAGCGTLACWRQGSEGLGSPLVGTLLMRVSWRQGSWTPGDEGAVGHLKNPFGSL